MSQFEVIGTLSDFSNPFAFLSLFVDDSDDNTISVVSVLFDDFKGVLESMIFGEGEFLVGSSLTNSLSSSLNQE